MIRVIQYSGSAGWGGAEMHMAQLATLLDRSRFSTAVVAHPGAAAEGLSGELETVSIPLVQVPRPRGKSDLRNVIRLATTFSTLARQNGGSGGGRAALLHCHLATPYDAHLALLAGRFAGLPTIISVHAYVTSPSAALARRARVMRHLTERVIVGSAAGARILRSDFGYGEREICVVHYGIDWKRFADTARSVRTLGSSPHRRVRIGYLGRLAPEKNLEAMVRAATLLRGEPIAILIAGRGPEGPSLSALIKRLDVGDLVTLVGPQEPTEFLPSLDVFTMTSHNEGLPLVLLEAMASGVPVMAPAIGGIPEALIHMQNGILLPPRPEAATVADAMRRLAADPSLRRDLGQCGIRTVRSRFNQERMAARIEIIYDDVCAGQRSVGVRSRMYKEGEHCRSAGDAEPR